MEGREITFLTGEREWVDPVVEEYRTVFYHVINNGHHEYMYPLKEIYCVNEYDTEED